MRYDHIINIYEVSQLWKETRVSIAVSFAIFWILAKPQSNFKVSFPVLVPRSKRIVGIGNEIDCAWR